MSNKSMIIFGDAMQKLKTIPNEYVDCCVTSPPYYMLRDYGVKGQIGLEESVEEYIAKLVNVFREVRRVLRDDGTLWLNIGDSYAGSGKGRNKDGDFNQKSRNIQSNGQKCNRLLRTKVFDNIKRKELIGIPWLLAFALRLDGWYIRQDIIWNKPNAMPESVKDRCTKSHEYIFLLTKSDKYYFDNKAIKEPAVGFDNSPPAGSRGTITPNSRRRKGNSKTFRGGGAYTLNRSFDNSGEVKRESRGNCENKTGLRNRRDVWSVATQGYVKAHFATFPEKLIEPCILAGSRSGGIVLDPFIGSGTTAVVAKRNNREYIGIDLNPEYIELAKERISSLREDNNA